MMKARLHPHWIGGRTGYLYSVIYEGKLSVERSRDPECDAARALVAQGFTGSLTICDGKTGIPRTIIDIERAAKLTAEEGACAPLLRKYRERYGSEGHSAETGSGTTTLPGSGDRAA